LEDKIDFRRLEPRNKSVHSYSPGHMVQVRELQSGQGKVRGNTLSFYRPETAAY